MHKVKLAGAVISIGFIILLSIAALLNPKSTFFQSPPPLEKFSTGIYAGHLSLPVLVAEKHGFFEANGLDVHIREFDSGLSALKALSRGEVEMATAAEIAFVNVSFKEANLKIISTIATSTVHEAVARKDSGITNPSDLRGKRIGISPGTSGEFFLMIFLVFNKISREEVHVVELPPSQIVEALATGEIDALVGWDIYVYQAKHALGDNYVSWPAQGGQDFYWLAISSQETISARPGAIENFLKSIIMAENFIRENEGAAKSILSDRWHFEKDYVEYHWPKTQFAISLDQSLITALEDGASWNLEADPGNKTQLPNYLRHIHFSSLNAVSPGAVTVFK